MNRSESVESLIDQLEEQAQQETTKNETPNIGIIMGSDSDFDVMMGTEDDEGAYDALDTLGFSEVTDFNNPPNNLFTFETFVVSAHRTPDLMYAYGQTADARGIDVIIAGAGGKSADLPNMTASIAYPIPVIGVPVQGKSVDSVIGMPTGAPITAVDAGKSFNAALSAVQVLSREHEELQDRLIEYHDQLRDGVGDVSREIHEMGTPEFRNRS